MAKGLSGMYSLFNRRFRPDPRTIARQGWEAVQQVVTIEEYAENHPELKAAIEVFSTRGYSLSKILSVLSIQKIPFESIHIDKFDSDNCTLV